MPQRVYVQAPDGSITVVAPCTSSTVADAAVEATRRASALWADGLDDNDEDRRAPSRQTSGTSTSRK